MNISIGPGVPVGSYPVTKVTTNGEVVSLANAFSVQIYSNAIFIPGVAPTSGIQGQVNENVNITGTLCEFRVTGTFTANFGSDITVNHITVNSNTSATANTVTDIHDGLYGRKRGTVQITLRMRPITAFRSR